MAGSMRRFLLLAIALAVFLAITVGIARQLGASSAERNAAVRAVKHQPQLRDAGTVRIVRYDGLGGVSLGGRSGQARVVWKIARGLPTVQCVRLRRTGDLISGYHVHVLGLSAPIPREDPCPKR